MYASPGQRASEIEAGAARPAAELRGDFTAALLADIGRKRAGSGEGPELTAWLTGRAPASPKLAAWL